MTTTGDVSTATPSPPDGVRAGLGYWLTSVHVMFLFDVRRARQWAGMMVVIQTMMGAAMALVYGFFYPHVDTTTALYIATGTPTLALIPLGFVLLPNFVGDDKTRGTLEYIWSLPAPRSAQAASTCLLYTLLSIPGAVLGLLAAVWRYDVHLQPSALLIPAALLCGLVAVTIGFGMAVAIPNPQVTHLITNTLIFVVLLFSPIVRPISHFPDRLADIHRYLPFYNMAVVIRAGLTNGVATHVTTAFIILIVWAIAACALLAAIAGRRS